jgi:signal transduction histidine kinase
VLGSIYVLAVLVLESLIMPRYVYRPLRRMLEADAATQHGDRDREMIPPGEILGDEIGQIMGPVTLRPLIDEAWGLVAIDDKSSTIQFANQVAPEVTVVGNPDRLIQVFVNLLRNALNAVESGTGKVDVRSRCGARGITTAVEDNGRGIPPDVLPDIFDAFVTTRLDARGTGLGLTVAEGIVTQHGGTISASNRAEGGARLEVTLPAAAP